MNLTMEEALELCEVQHPGKIPGHILCPFHDEATPSLAVWDDHYHCFGCGQGGSAFDFVAQALAGGNYKLAFQYIIRAIDPEELERRPQRSREPEIKDLTDEFEMNSVPWHKEAIDFFDEKWPHLDIAWVEEHFGVRSGRYNILVPHYSPRGRVVGVKTRSFTGGNRGAKSAFLGSTFTTQLYRDHSYVATFAASDAVLVEGESDTWTFTKHYWGKRHVYGLPSGARCWKPAFKERLLKYSRIHVWLDNDETGREASRIIRGDLSKTMGGPYIYDHTVPLDYKDVTEAVIDGWTPQP